MKSIREARKVLENSEAFLCRTNTTVTRAARSRNEKSIQEILDSSFIKEDSLYDCVICSVTELKGSNLIQHLAGRRHQKNMNEPSKRDLIIRSTMKTETRRGSRSSRSSKAKKDEYKEELKKAREEILRVHTKHLEDPSLHPAYEDEWRKFWEHRYMEVKKEGKIDPEKHDYKSEWPPYWMKKMKRLFEKEIEMKKREIRRKFEISSDSSEEEVAASKSKSVEKDRKRTRQEFRDINRNETKDEDNRHSKKSKVIEHYEIISSSEDSESFNRNQEETKMKKYLSKSAEFGQKSDLVKPEPVTMISVCRLLVALDSELGSLAPKALDLLAKTIEVYKEFPDSAEEILLNNENSVLLEVVKEKMKGLLMIEIYSTHKTSAIKTLIKNIEELIKKSKGKIVDPKVKPKSSFAEDLAKLLTAYGKETFSVKQAQVLIEVFSKEKGKQIKNEKSPDVCSSNESSIKSLSDEEIHILVEHFEELFESEQHHVINYFDILQKSDPARFERLRKGIDSVKAKKEKVVNAKFVNNKIPQKDDKKNVQKSIQK